MPEFEETEVLCLSCNATISKQNLKFCSNACQKDWNYKDFIKEWLAGNRNGVSGRNTSRYIHRYLREQKNQCWKCGWGVTHPLTGRVPLDLDHINGKWDDNKPENLRLLCPNCHSLTATYKGLNRGKTNPGRYKNKTEQKVVTVTPDLHCFICKKILIGNATKLKTGLCAVCEHKSRRIFEVTKEELAKLISTTSMTEIGKMFGVTDTAIRKRCKVLGISLETALNRKTKT